MSVIRAYFYSECRAYAIVLRTECNVAKRRV